MFNFRDITEMFLKNNAGIMVKDSSELEEDLKVLLGNKNRISQLGKASREIILKNQGATARNAEAIRLLLETRKCGKI
jgi:3-deoxy-D-manno-octulosonic-acid transferase